MKEDKKRREETTGEFNDDELYAEVELSDQVVIQGIAEHLAHQEDEKGK